jgi:predicted nucleic acid-binding protein
LSRRYALDAGALSLFFAGREEVKLIIDGAYSGEVKLLMCEVNVAEFLYNCARVLGWEAALARHALVRNSPIEIVGVDEKLTVVAARLKLRHARKLSLADCYLLALAKLQKAAVVTADASLKEVSEAPVVLVPI